MKQSLQLKLGQQLTMTPQLQQAIRLLQMSTLDLQQEIQEALESNPMLEEDFQDDSPSETSNQDNIEASSNPDDNTSEEQSSLDDNGDWQNDIPEDLPVDTQWEDIYQSTPTAPASSDNADYDIFQTTSSKTDLLDELYWQLNLTSLVDSDRAMAHTIIDAVEPTGLLGQAPEDLFASLDPELDVDFEDFEAVRQMIQEFEPVGVASRDLRECLLVQLKQFPERTPFLNDARLIIDKYLSLLGTHDYAQLKRRTKFKEGRLKGAIDLIQSLTPHPGDKIEAGDTEYITPDVYVRKHKNTWQVELSAENHIRLRVNDDYAALVKRADNSPDNNFLRDNLQEARWFIKSLQSRNETLLRVASKIVEHQRGFLEHGEEAMRPLILQDIAQDLDLHESTISRVTTRKYMHTPRGIFELKFFFSSHVGTESGGECSSTAIRAIIKKFIANENEQKPLSDSKIAKLLEEQGIKVARRTVAKYRESMSIPPSNERKRLA